MKRQVEDMVSSLGAAKVKICTYKDIRKIYPEYESVAALARSKKMDFQKVYEIIRKDVEKMNNYK